MLAIIAGAAAGRTPARAQQNTDELDVGVRTQVEHPVKIERPDHISRLQEAPAHGKIYAILAIQPAWSKERLVNPVDATALEHELSLQLNAHGYHPVEPHHKPEILLTVAYGRGWLPNPYYTDEINVDNMGPIQGPDSYAATQTYVVDSPKIASRLSEFGVEAKATKAGYEKLFILVRAWKYPTSPKEKPQALWVTTMLVDDPDHRDLNGVYKQMLAAGAPFFDRELKEEEVELSKPLPEGHVKLGPTEVVEEPKAKSP